MEAIQDDPECTCCGGTGVTYQTERRCACQPPEERRWRYDICYGPDGEADYAYLFTPEGLFVGNLRTHHAAKIVEACNAYAVINREAGRAALKGANNAK